LGVPVAAALVALELVALAEEAVLELFELEELPHAASARQAQTADAASVSRPAQIRRRVAGPLGEPPGVRGDGVAPLRAVISPRSP